MTILELADQYHQGGKNTSGATYVTKVSWAQDAYLHTIIKPAEPELREAIAAELDFPPSLIAHFRKCNGGFLFCASTLCLGLHLFGCVRPEKTISRRLDGDPTPTDIRMTDRDIKMMNRNMTDLQKQEFIIFAVYGADLSVVLVNRKDETVRCCRGRDLSTTRNVWKNIDEWESHEFARLSKLFTPEGKCLVSCDDLLPPDLEKHENSNSGNL